MVPIGAVEVIEFPEKKAPLRVDLGCGGNKREGYFGIDFVKEGTSADFECNLFTFPWPLKDGSVDEFYSSHFFEHVPRGTRGKFMDEVWRCLKVGGVAEFITPFAWSNRSIQDYTHEWPPIVGESYLYFMKSWRKLNKLEHGFYDLKCDFELVNLNYILNQEGLAGREVIENDPVLRTKLNIIDDMRVVLRRK